MIFEGAIATPRSVEENIRRGRMAMGHVIESHTFEPRAMYREELGWIGFRWGEAGEEPPKFSSPEEFRAWQKTGRKPYDRGGNGVSHIIAKRDWEGKHIEEFLGQKGLTVAYKLVEVIARGSAKIYNQKAEIIWRGYAVILQKGKKYGMDFWLLSGYMPPQHGYHYVCESAGEAAVLPIRPSSTHIWPTPYRPYMGATDSVFF